MPAIYRGMLWLGSFLSPEQGCPPTGDAKDGSGRFALQLERQGRIGNSTDLSREAGLFS